MFRAPKIEEPGLPGSTSGPVSTSLHVEFNLHICLENPNLYSSLAMSAKYKEQLENRDEIRYRK